MRAQLERYAGEQRGHGASASADAAAVNAELTKLRAEEERYAKAYGAGLFDLDRLKEYAAPVRARIAGLERQLLEFGSPRNTPPGFIRLNTDQLDAFAMQATGKLSALNFEGRRAIVTRVIEKVVGSQKQLIVSGHLPIFEHVKNEPNDRYGVSTTRHSTNDNLPILPFEFFIELPAPNYQTVKGCKKMRVVA